MRAAASLELVDAGSLTRPGPVGRLVRLGLGALCLYAVGAIVVHWAGTASHPISSLDARWPLLLVPLCVFNYVVDIGFGRNWGSWPLLISLAGLIGFAGLSLLVAGTADSAVLGVPLNLWLGYCYGHLGISFIVAAMIATPGCEMRAIPGLLDRMRGKPSLAHRCPVAFLGRIDEWERGRAADHSGL